jgi:membrane protein
MLRSRHWRPVTLGAGMWLVRVRAFLGHLSSRFCADRCLVAAAGLSYGSLLSLVPLMTVAFAVLAAFPVFQAFSTDIQDFIFKNFVPAFGEQVESHLRQFVEQAKGLTSLGVLFLILAALLLMAEIERALNDIWHVRRRRRALSSFLVYWAVLSLGPVLIGVSLAITSYLVSLPLFSHTAGLSWVLRAMPFVLSTLAFTLLYTVVPNRNVPLRHALVGAVVAAMLFELANRAFAFYVTHFPAYQIVYGALAAIPVFLIWIYVSWVVILLGAEVTHALSTFRYDPFATKARPEKVGLLEAYRVIGYLWEAQTQGLAVSETRLLELEPAVDETSLEELLQALEDRRLLQRTAAGHWMLARDVSELTLGELAAQLPYPLPAAEAHWKDRDLRNRALAAVLSDTRACLEQRMRVALKDLYKKKDDAPS